MKKQQQKNQQVGLNLNINLKSFCTVQETIKMKGAAYKNRRENTFVSNISD